MGGFDISYLEHRILLIESWLISKIIHMHIGYRDGRWIELAHTLVFLSSV
jgi:hypothetical protein